MSATEDAHADHQRRLAAERARRFRERKRNATHGLVTRDGVAVTARERRVITSMVTGMTKCQALQEAGFKANSSIGERLKPGGDLALVLHDALIAHGATLDVPIKARMDAVKATRRVVSNEGYVEVEDHAIRLSAAEAIAKDQRDAGMRPADAAQLGGSGGLHYHLHLDNLRQCGSDNESIHKPLAQPSDIVDVE